MQPRSPTWQADFYRLSHQRSPRELETDQVGSHGPGSKFRGHVVRPGPWLPIPGILGPSSSPEAGSPLLEPSEGERTPLAPEEETILSLGSVASLSSGLSLECDDRAWEVQLPRLSPEGRPQVNLEGLNQDPIYGVPGLGPARLEVEGRRSLTFRTTVPTSCGLGSQHKPGDNNTPANPEPAFWGTDLLSSMLTTLGLPRPLCVATAALPPC